MVQKGDEGGGGMLQRTLCDAGLQRPAKLTLTLIKTEYWD